MSNVLVPVFEKLNAYHQMKTAYVEKEKFMKSTKSFNIRTKTNQEYSSKILLLEQAVKRLNRMNEKQERLLRVPILTQVSLFGTHHGNSLMDSPAILRGNSGWGSASKLDSKSPSLYNNTDESFDKEDNIFGSSHAISIGVKQVSDLHTLDDPMQNCTGKVKEEVMFSFADSFNSVPVGAPQEKGISVTASVVAQEVVSVEKEAVAIEQANKKEEEERHVVTARLEAEQLVFELAAALEAEKQRVAAKVTAKEAAEIAAAEKEIAQTTERAKMEADRIAQEALDVAKDPVKVDAIEAAARQKHAQAAAATATMALEEEMRQYKERVLSMRLKKSILDDSDELLEEEVQMLKQELQSPSYYQLSHASSVSSSSYTPNIPLMMTREPASYFMPPLKPLVLETIPEDELASSSMPSLPGFGRSEGLSRYDQAAMSVLDVPDSVSVTSSDHSNTSGSQKKKKKKRVTVKGLVKRARKLLGMGPAKKSAQSISVNGSCELGITATEKELSGRTPGSKKDVEQDWSAGIAYMEGGDQVSASSLGSERPKPMKKYSGFSKMLNSPNYLFQKKYSKLNANDSYHSITVDSTTRNTEQLSPVPKERKPSAEVAESKDTAPPSASPVVSFPAPILPIQSFG
jgi:hypothetical protein